MLSPCEKHILCPTGTGVESGGVNYSSEDVDVPTETSVYYPPVEPYGYYTACVGRCQSIVSQQAADLCAQQMGTICKGDVVKGGPGNTPKQKFTNTPQICTEPNTGRLVTVPAGVFTADSQAEANAQALSYANKAQKSPATPPGVSHVPPPGSGSVPGGINVIPVPVPQPPQPTPPPPTSDCKPCDDTGAVSTFDLVCDVPSSTVSRAWETPTLKCGQWSFSVTTDDGGPVGSPQWFVTMNLVVNNADRTYVDWGSLTDCPQMAYQCPCGHGESCDPQDVQQLGFFPGCCDVTSSDCKYVECQEVDGAHYMVRLRVDYSCLDEFNPPKKFTVHGTLVGPLPSTP